MKGRKRIKEGTEVALPKGRAPIKSALLASKHSKAVLGATWSATHPPPLGVKRGCAAHLACLNDYDFASVTLRPLNRTAPSASPPLHHSVPRKKLGYWALSSGSKLAARIRTAPKQPQKHNNKAPALRLEPLSV